MFTRLINAMGLLLVGTMAGLHAYWHLASGWWFAGVAISVLVLFTIGVFRVKPAFRSLFHGDFDDGRMWLSLIALPVLIGCVARLVHSVLAFLWGVASFNMGLVRQHDTYSFIALFAVTVVIGLLILRHQTKKPDENREEEDDAENKVMALFTP